LQLSKAKNQFLGQMALSEENGLNTAIGAARALLHFGKVNSFEGVAEKIRSISAEEVMDAANDYLTAESAYELVYKKI
jgi:predicted Zn-dependent peptidase